MDHVAFGLAGGCVTVIGAACLAALAFRPGDTGARLLLMALAAGVLGAVLADWKACLGVTVFAVLVYVGFLADRDGDLLAHSSAWSYALLIGLAAVAGRGQRWMRRSLTR